MNITSFRNQFFVLFGIFLLICCQHSFAQKQPNKKDTTKAISPQDSARRPTFRLRDRYGDPFSNSTSYSPLFLKDPKTLNLDVQIDTGMNYSIYEKIGKINFRPTSSMSFKEFNLQQDRVNMKQYWKNRSQALDGESAVSGRNLLPKIFVSPLLDRIFGGSFVEIIPRGNVALDFGASFQTIKNPAIPIRQQSNGGFEFDQQINLSVTGKIGEKLKVGANFDTNNSFDFQNSMKIEYTGFKEDILRKLELGNVSLPLNNSLITGASNLFGVKAQMQFGKLSVTTVASTQRGKQTSIEIPGSTSGTSQGRQFEVIGSNYDDNRHFFLAQFFRDQFEDWLKTLPQLTSGVNITRVEVYVMNRNNDTQTLRDVVGLMDMGESKKIYKKDIKDADGTSLVRPDYLTPNFPASNEANNLFTKDKFLRRISAQSDQVNAGLEGLGFANGLDFEKITSARKLSATEFSYHKELGYITLQRKLQNDEALAVAFEYTYNGQPYKVGELTEDYSNKPDNQVVFLKLLRPREVSVKDNLNVILPTWNLMMKNVYNLNLNQVAKEGFQLKIIYRDDATGKDNPQLQESGVAGTRQLISITGLDRLNPYNDPSPDGNFDFVENVTINTNNGLVIFPFLEPFNKPFRDLFKTDPSNQDRLNTKYLYDTLYNTTKAEAELVATKNKFFIVGTSKSGSGKVISLQGFNVAQGSVKVFAGGAPLREGADYQVDYMAGNVTILNEGVLSSGKNISVTYEQQDPFAFQTRSLVGTRLDYKLSDDINIGSTLLYYNERALISRNAIGSEPARNLQYGLDINFKKDSRLLTKMVDALPFLQTKEKSTITLNAEFAQLLPGTSNSINGDGTSFIDDFENSATPNSLLNPVNWKLASVPNDLRFDLSNGEKSDLGAGYRRAKLAWYQVDNLFYRTGGAFKPDNITEKDLENHYIRPVLPREIFPGFDPQLGNFFQPIFDLAYFPKERGPYNFNPDLNADGTLKNPEKNWAGITTDIRSEVDFDKANVEYVEFWLMDPFINSANGRILDGNPNPQPNQTGGKLIFQLGSISEDLMRDGKHAFENGLPTDGDLTKLDGTKNWGYVTSQQYTNNAFDNAEGSRVNQDVGLDGIGNAKEADYFKDFLNAVSSSTAKEIVRQDPSADDFKYFLGNDLDAKDAKVLERYKNINGLENNTPVPNAGDAFARSGSTTPDNEDLNRDNTLSDLEEYYSYTLDLLPNGPNRLDVGNRFVVDKIDNELSGDKVTWYLVRIPVKQFDAKVGDINGFKSIRYARMLLTGFTQPVVLRMANFRTVGNRWRQYTANLEEAGLTKTPEVADNLSVSVVNIEENSKGNDVKPPYVAPLARDRDNTSTVVRRLNEQAIQMCVSELRDGDARAIYKNVSMDFYNYGRIKMFVSAHGTGLQDNQLTAFMRLGTDFEKNYYEVEIPLKITPNGETVPDADIWPEQNQFDIELNDLYELKARRNREGVSREVLYPLNGSLQSGKHGLRIFGTPDLSGVRLIMIGVRNPKSTDKKPLSVCVWANELRLTDFDRQAGWAVNAVLNAKLADLGNITTSIRHSTPGYGNVQSKISERTRAQATAFDISGTINIEKLLPRKLGLKIPMFASYESIISNPDFDPANPDLRIRAVLTSFNTDDERSSYLKLIQDKTIRRSLNFTNVKKVKLDPKAKSHIYDVENFAFSYAYSSSEQTNFNLSENTRRGYRGSVAWQYSSTFKGIEPFKNVKWLSSPFLQLIKDFNFNPMPSSISVRGDLDRAFSKIVNRNSSTDAFSSQPNFSKYFVFNRSYNLRWALTKSLSLDYSSRVNAIIDEPDGDLNTQKKRDSVINNLKRFGRTKAFDQNVTANYTLPLDKLPLTNWLGADYRHNVGFAWRAGPLEKADSLKLGNIIQNTREQAVNGKIDLLKLYNKIGFLKDVNNPRPKPTAAELAKTKSDRADTIKRPPELSGIKSLLRLVMTVRSVTGTYSVTSGTSLAGFMLSPYLFGNDKGWQAPGWNFILGSQDADIRFKAAENGWLSRSKKLTTPFMQNETKDLNLRTSLEPFPDFKVQLDARKTSTSAFQEIFRDSTGNGDYRGLSPSRTGSYKISMAIFATTFANNGSLTSTVYEEFKSNIQTIKERFNNVTGQGYEDQSQDVLIPAFIAAYSGKSAEKVSLSPFPNIPIPNWNMSYGGLSKIPVLKELFQSISINHAYNSSYSVLNYSNSLRYRNVPISNPVEEYNVRTDNFARLRNSNGSLVPVYVIQNVIISEQFAPLIGVNVMTKSKVSMRFEYKTKRDLSLNVSNAQITEMLGTDWSLDVGFIKNNLRLPFKQNGRTVTLKNDVTFKLTMSLQDTRTILRKLEEVSSIVNGNVNFQLRPNISYLANKKLTIQGYYDYNTNEPLLSNSFPRSNTRAGFKIVYNLAQ